jgi:receptor protein-tyrosine kinase
MTIDTEQLDVERTHHLDLERVLAVLRRRWWIIALLTVLVGVAAFIFSESQPRKYTANAAVLFSSSQLNQQASGLVSGGSSAAIFDPVVMATNVQLLSHPGGVARQTARAVGRGVTPGEVASSVSVSQQGTTNVATVSATTNRAVTAAAIANNWARTFIFNQRIQQQNAVNNALGLVERQIAAMTKAQLNGLTGQGLVDRAESLRILGKLQNGNAQIVSYARPPSGPSSPKVARSTLLGLVLGLLLGLIVAFVLERLDRRMKSVEDLEAAYRLPLLAAVPRSRSYALPPRLDAADHAGDSEVFKLLRAYLRYFNVDRELRTLLVASAAPGDGKSTIARNLGEAAQETGSRTLLIECDLRRPTLARHYGLSLAPGLSELLSGSVTVHEAIQSIPVATRVNGATSEVSLDLLVAGHPPPNPAELVESKAMAEVLSWAGEHYDLVVIDTPPLGAVSDAMSLLRRVDGVILVSQLGKNSRDAAAFLRKRLVGVNAPLLGVVANGVKGKGEAGYGYGYGYGYSYTARDESEDREDALAGT